MTECRKKPISSLAVASLEIALLSAVSVLAIAFWPLSPIAVAACAVAVVRCRRYDLAGKRCAQVGLLLAIGLLVATPAWHFHLYRSESAADHLRLDFAEVLRGSPRRIERYLGQQVCLKGYGVAEGAVEDLQAFELSVDGGNWLKDESIVVVLSEGETWDWARAPIAVSGTLVRDSAETAGPNRNPPLRLIHATVRLAQTTAGLAHRSRDGC